MNIFHKKAVKVEPESHLNFMGGKSFDINNPILKLRIVASSSFFGEPQYYRDTKEDNNSKKITNINSSSLSIKDINYLREQLDAIDFKEWRSKSPAELIESVIDEALGFDPRATLQEAIRLRNEDNIRTTPQVILVRAAHHKNVKGTGLVRLFAADIIKRADEPSVGLAYHLWAYKDAPIPNSLKKAWRDSLSKFNEYELSKYRMENRAVKTVDVINLVHPKSEVVSSLSKNTLRVTDKTWEGIISTKGSSKENWTQAIDVMGHMALLRNLHNFIVNNVDVNLYKDKLIKTAEKGKQLPFRYYSAYKILKQNVGVPAKLFDAVEDCLISSFENMPHFNGKVMSLCDNSGSAHEAFTSTAGTMTVAEIANLSAVLIGHCADDGHVGIFGDSLETMPIMKRGSVFEQVDKVCSIGRNIGLNTENGIWLFLNNAIKNKEHWDHIFVFSDMQAGHGGLYGLHQKDYNKYQWASNPRNIDVASLIKEYRKQVNPNVMVYMCQVAGYQDTLIPEFYNRTFILGGWGEGMFKFANEMNKLFNPNQ